MARDLRADMLLSRTSRAMDDSEDAALETLLVLGAARERDLRHGGALLAAANDWRHEGEDLRLPATVLRFCASHNCSPDVVAELLRPGTRA